MIEQNGISVNGIKEKNINRIVEFDDFIDNELVIQKGKKSFVKIKFI